MAKAKRKGLGKGLGALITVSDTVLEDARPRAGQALSDGSRLLELNPRDIRPNPKQPRRNFDEDSLAELAESIRRDGVQEPVVVREQNGGYELVSGERRVRASILAECELIPAVCRNVTDQDMLKLGLIENIQREDLNPMELAEAYQTLTREFHWTQEELAKQIGKKRVTITNTLRLLNLPGDVQQHVAEGRITSGHARALLALEGPDKQSRACRKAIEEGLSVRQVEKMASRSKPKRVPAQGEKDAHVLEIEDDLRRRFGTRVNLKTNSKYRGKVEIEFFGLDDLQRILDLLRS